MTSCGIKYKPVVCSKTNNTRRNCDNGIVCFTDIKTGFVVKVIKNESFSVLYKDKYIVTQTIYHANKHKLCYLTVDICNKVDTNDQYIFSNAH